MNFDEYQKRAIQTDSFNADPATIDSHAFVSHLLGLVGESGEVADKFKKLFRDKNAKITPDDIEEIAKELGDTLWYISAICCYLGLSLEEVAQKNLKKVHSRKRRDQTKGSGDNR